MTTKKKKNATFFDLGLSCLGMATINFAFNFMSPIITTIFLGTGMSCVIHHITDKNNKLKKLWRGLGLDLERQKPTYRGKEITSYGYCLRFSIPIGTSTNFFEKKKEEIRQFLDRENNCKKINIKYGNGGNMLWEIYTTDLKKEYLYEDYEDKIKSGIRHKLEIPLGFFYGDKLIKLDLKKAIHVLIAGETDSGKSTLFRMIITWLLTQSNIKMYLCDFKFGGVEFKMFSKHPNVVDYINKKEDALEMLSKIYAEVERRGDLFAKYEDVTNIYEYNKKNPKNTLPNIVVAIDEIAMLRKKDSRDSITIIEDLAQISRYTGIHLICATQKPSIKENVITTIMKGNFPTTIGLRTHGKTESIQVIDETGLEELRGYGHGMLKLKGEIQEFQGINLTPSKAIELIKASINDKRKESCDTKSKSPRKYKSNRAVFIKNTIRKEKENTKEKFINDFFGGDK